MTKRSLKYFKRQWILRRLAINQWHLDWMMMANDGKSNMAFMLPEAGITHADGTDIQIRYIDPQPPEYFELKEQLRMKMQMPNQKFNPHLSYGITDGKFTHLTYTMPNQAPTDERSVATDS